jgi:FMNH2-dependent dimethyl sulfone monooxygenase
MEFETHRAIAKACEDAQFDYVFMADAWGPYGPHAREAKVQDPILLSPMVGLLTLQATERLRCITTVHTTWFHPLAVARMGATLDTMSKGRWGINVVTGAGFGQNLDGDLFGGISHDARYDRACETVEILTQAWGRGEIDFRGKHFNIHGPLVGPKAWQQPRPLVVSAGASDAGRGFAGRYADYVFMPGRTPKDELQRRIGDIRSIAMRHGRRAEDVKLQMHASIVVRETDKEAQEYSEWLAEQVDLDVVVEYLNAVRSQISTYDDVYAQLGELQMRQIGSVSGARKVHGGAEAVADHVERLHREFGADGIAITLPVWSPEEVKRVGDILLPRLAERGIWEPPSARDYGW